MIGRVNEEVLALTIIEQPLKRMQKVEFLRDAVNQIRVLIDDAFVPLEKMGMRCRFCGRGQYETVLDTSKAGAPHPPEGRFYLLQGSKWRMMACNHCGHLEHFRFDLHDNVKVW